MTPKEKATELVDKNYDKMFYLRDGYNSSDVYEAAKQCALIAVDEIIDSSPSAPILSDAGSFVNDIEESTEWWQEVKQEIEKL